MPKILGACATLLLLGAIGCGSSKTPGDSGTPGDAGTPDTVESDAASDASLPDAASPDAEPFDGGPAVATLILELTDLDDLPVVGAEASALGVVARSDGRGIAELDLPSAGLVHVIIRSESHAPKTTTLWLEEGESFETGVIMIRYQAPVAFDVAAGVLLESSRLQIQIPPNALVDEMGAPATGMANVKVAFIQPDDPSALRAQPGRLLGISRGPGNEFALLETYGMVEVSVTAGAKPLNLAPGMMARLTVGLPLPLAERAMMSNDVTGWSFDLAAGQWVEDNVDGTIAITEFRSPFGSDYRYAWTGQLPHLSWWNADRPRAGGRGAGGMMSRVGCVAVKVISKETRRAVRGAEVIFEEGAVQSSFVTTATGAVCEMGKAGGDPVRIHVFAPGYRPETREVNFGTGKCADPNTGPDCEKITIEVVAKPSCFRGTVLAPDGTPADDVIVSARLLDQDDHATTVVTGVTRTDAVGEFCVDGIQNRKFMLTAVRKPPSGGFEFARGMAGPPTHDATCMMGTCDMGPSLRLQPATAVGCVCGYGRMFRSLATAAATKPLPSGVPLWVYPDDLIPATCQDLFTMPRIKDGAVQNDGNFCIDGIPIPTMPGVPLSSPFGVAVAAGNCGIAASISPATVQITQEGSSDKGTCANLMLPTEIVQKAADFTAAQVKFGQTLLRPNLQLVIDKPGAVFAYLIATPTGFGGPIDVYFDGPDTNAKKAARLVPMMMESDCGSPHVEFPFTAHATGQSAQLRIDPDGRWFDNNTQNNTSTFMVPAFSPSDLEVKVKLLSIGSTVANYPGGNAAQLLADVRNILPVGTIRSSNSATPLTFVGHPHCGPAGTDFHAEWDRVLMELCGARMLENYPGNYLGLVPTGRCTQTATTIGGKADIGNFQLAVLDTAYPSNDQRTVMHELGHAFCLLHAPCGPAGSPDPSYPMTNPPGYIEECGYNQVTGETYDAFFRPDFMGYCPPPNWSSAYDYFKFRDAMEGAACSRDPSVCNGTGMSDQEVSLMVMGKIRASSVELSPVHLVHAGSTPPDRGPYTLELETIGGKKVTHRFPTQHTAPSEGGEPFELFGFAVPNPGPLLALEIRRGNEVIEHRKAHGDAALPKPEVEQLKNQLRVRWDAARYPYLMVTHVGAAINALAIQLTGGSARVDTTGVPHGGRYDLSFSDGITTRVVSIPNRAR